MATVEIHVNTEELGHTKLNLSLEEAAKLRDLLVKTLPNTIEKCIVCDKPVLTQREGRIHDECYTPEVVRIVQDDP